MFKLPCGDLEDIFKSLNFIFADVLGNTVMGKLCFHIGKWQCERRRKEGRKEEKEEQKKEERESKKRRQQNELTTGPGLQTRGLVNVQTSFRKLKISRERWQFSAWTLYHLVLVGIHEQYQQPVLIWESLGWRWPTMAKVVFHTWPRDFCLTTYGFWENHYHPYAGYLRWNSWLFIDLTFHLIKEISRWIFQTLVLLIHLPISFST